jgi:hypothetical protein
MKRLTLALTAALVCTALSAFADAGGTDRGNPGDDYALEFADVGRDIAASLAKDPIPGVDAKVFEDAVDHTKVYSVEHLFKGTQEVAGLNFPDPKDPYIQVSRTRWDAKKGDPWLRAQVVFHEYLGILGVHDEQGQVSNLLDRAKVCERQPAIRSALERELKKSCYRIISDDLRYVRELDTQGAPMGTAKVSDLSSVENLEHVNFTGSGPTVFEPGFFANFTHVKHLHLGSTMQNLSDCSFLRPMVKLEDFSIGDSSYDTLHSKFAPLTAVQPGCFAGIPSLKWVGLSIDGKTTKLAGFLRGSRAAGISLDGVNIDLLSADEFVGLDNIQINLKSYGAPISDGWLQLIEKRTGFGGDAMGNSRSDDGTLTYNATLYKHD